jgi:hypothetical protein
MSQIAAAAPRATYGPPKEGAKVILGDTSIDGPAIVATDSPATALAWVGTDAAHHLNLMTSSDGLHYAAKRILPETSLWRPALAFVDSGRGAPYGTIVLAWTGTDASHTLNVEFISMPDFTVTRKVILWGETSFTAPALATVNSDVNSDVYLSWAGTDRAHTVNIMHLQTNTQTRDKHTLWGWSSLSRPNLARDLSSDNKGPLILSWLGASNRIYFAYASEDRSHWTMPAESPLSAQSAWAPSMIGAFTMALPTHWLAWTGSGTPDTHRLSVRYTQHFPAWSDANATTALAEYAISSPALAFNGNGPTDQVLMAWTGTDSQHHLNVAVITV